MLERMAQPTRIHRLCGRNPLNTRQGVYRHTDLHRGQEDSHSGEAHPRGYGSYVGDAADRRVLKKRHRKQARQLGRGEVLAQLRQAELDARLARQELTELFMEAESYLVWLSVSHEYRIGLALREGRFFGEMANAG